MGRGEVRTSPIDGVVYLTLEVCIVLTGKCGYGAGRFALASFTVTRDAQRRVYALTTLHEGTGALAHDTSELKVVHIRRDIRDRLSIGKVVVIGEVLHPRIPATVEAIINQLLHEDGGVLAGDSRNVAVERALALHPMANPADSKERLAVLEIGTTVQSSIELCASRGGRRRIVRGNETAKEGDGADPSHPVQKALHNQANGTGCTAGTNPDFYVAPSRRPV